MRGPLADGVVDGVARQAVVLQHARHVPQPRLLLPYYMRL